MAGSYTVTRENIGGGYNKYTIAWTSSAGGAVSGTPFDLRRCNLVQAKFVPGSGGNQPTDLYDMTLLDADGVDLLLGLGTDRSNASTQVAPALSGEGEPPKGIRWFAGGAVTPTISGGGNAKTGTLILYISP